MDSWQTLAVQVRNDKLAVYHAPRGKAPRLLGGDIAVSTTMNTNALRLGVSGQSGFRFDSVSVHARALDAAKSTTYAYNTSNQLTSSVTNSVTTSYTYDAWGRLLTRTAGTATASYAYRGDKLKQVTSTFPNEDSVAMNYDGLGRRRNRMANGVTPITWWRYGLGWDTVAEYTDNDTDWAVEGFSKFNVMTDFMHPLAEATVASGQPPANAAYSYLALDHLSSTRGVFSQTKTQTGTMEFLPYGARHTTTSGTLPYHQFTAKPYDTGTGLYNFPYRHYSPAMARWTAADPIGTMDGPNVYHYISAPSKTIDPLGLFPIIITFPPPEFDCESKESKCLRDLIDCRLAAGVAYDLACRAISSAADWGHTRCTGMAVALGPDHPDVRRCYADVDKKAQTAKDAAMAIFRMAIKGCNLVYDDCMEKARNSKVEECCIPRRPRA